MNQFHKGQKVSYQRTKTRRETCVVLSRSVTESDVYFIECPKARAIGKKFSELRAEAQP